MNNKTRLAIACMVALGGAAALALATAQTTPPAPPGGMTGSDAPNTAGYDSTISWAVNSGPQSSSITINFPPSSTGGGGGGGTPPPPPPPQPVPMGANVNIGVQNANSGILSNSASGNYNTGRLGGDPVPFYTLILNGDFSWPLDGSRPRQTVHVSVGRVPNNPSFPTTGSHNMPGSTCTRGDTPEMLTCTETVAIGGQNWLFTVVGSGMLRADCFMPPGGGRSSCMLSGHATVTPAP